MLSTGFALAAFVGESAAECGKAAWYDVGGMTASGEVTPDGALTAAHRTLPFGTRVKVDNLANGRSVVVRINDRGPFVGGRVIDVSRAAAEKLGFVNAGIAPVQLSTTDGKAIKGACAEPSGRSTLVVAVSANAADPVPFPRARPRIPAASVKAAEFGSREVPIPAKTRETIAARFDDAFAESDVVELEMSKALQAFADQQAKAGRSD